MTSPQFDDFERQLKQNSRGDITVLVEGDAIVQRFLNRLLTPVGSRLSRPNFGSNLYEIIHEPIDEESAGFIEMEIYRIANLEPGINVRGVDITDFPNDNPRRREVEIKVDSPSLSQEQIASINITPDGIEPAPS
jgi:phage baseplate assembly protein W